MRKCLIHIGGHKTGTSAIQKALASDQEMLKSHQWFYSLSCKYSIDYSANNLALAIFSNDEKLISDNLANLEMEIINFKDLNMILSSELLATILINKHKQSLKLLDLLNKNFDHIDVIYYIRDIIEWTGSIFKQYVTNQKDPYSKSIHQYINDSLYIVPSIKDIISSWKNTKLFNNIYLAWYSKNFDNNIEPILNTCGIFNMSIKNPGIINKSLDGKLLRINYFYNSIYKSLPYDFIRILKKIRNLNNQIANPAIIYKTNIVPSNYYSQIRNLFEQNYQDTIKHAIVLNEINNSSIDYGVPFEPIKNKIEWDHEINTIKDLGYDIFN